MLGIASTRVHVAIVFGHKINIMKTIAIVVILIESVDESSVHDYGLVEGAIAILQAPIKKCFVTIEFCRRSSHAFCDQIIYLFGDKYAVVELLALEKRVKIRQKCHQMIPAISVWNDDGDLLWQQRHQSE